MNNPAPTSELEMSNICVLNVGYAQTQHRWGGTDISSPFARIYYVKTGRAILHLQDQDLELVPGYMYLLPRFLPHSYLCDPGFEFYYMFVYMRYGEQQGLFETHTLPYSVKANEGTDLLFTNFCQMYPQLSLPSRDADARTLRASPASTAAISPVRKYAFRVFSGRSPCKCCRRNAAQFLHRDNDPATPWCFRVPSPRVP